MIGRPIGSGKAGDIKVWLRDYISSEPRQSGQVLFEARRKFEISEVTLNRVWRDLKLELNDGPDGPWQAFKRGKKWFWGDERMMPKDIELPHPLYEMIDEERDKLIGQMPAGQLQRQFDKITADVAKLEGMDLIPSAREFVGRMKRACDALRAEMDRRSKPVELTPFDDGYVEDSDIPL